MSACISQTHVQQYCKCDTLELDSMLGYQSFTSSSSSSQLSPPIRAPTMSSDFCTCKRPVQCVMRTHHHSKIGHLIYRKVERLTWSWKKRNFRAISSQRLTYTSMSIHRSWLTDRATHLAPEFSDFYLTGVALLESTLVSVEVFELQQPDVPKSGHSIMR